MIRVAKALLITCCFVSVANGRVETVRFQSKLINTTLPYNIILPSDYDTSKTTRYPVLYLLHGLTGHYNDWISRTNIADYAAGYRIIIVMPEGNDGWYTDSVAVPTDKYESYILQELIPDVQQRRPGDHSWAYWDQQVQEVLKIAAEKMRLPRIKRISRA